ncbi:MAG: DNA topoisomerase 4 subunit A [Anaerolineae bacterium]|nr:DNA topoisomerase 4 subunit A [Anaerolineae bacterium]
MAEQMINNEVHSAAQPLDEFIESAYRRYAILTILDRALPDARDGLKPVQRRILYAMHDMNITFSGPHKKSARVVGEVMGKYHPHGDQAIYDTMVRMAQDFSMREPLIDGQGNFGSIDGDSAAAMRYTEARLTRLGESMLDDIEKNTVDWKPNFDDSLREPAVLPTRYPNLLVNGNSGIAVGMSTSILPHNLGEVCDAVVYVAKNWKTRQKITVEKLMELIPGPDFPTGGLLYRYRSDKDEENVDMIKMAYEEGKATLVCQARAEIRREIGGGKSEIIVTELPYQVQKNTILERIATNKEKFPGLTDVRDESDFNGMRVVFEVGRNADPNEVLDLLLTHTQMRSSLSQNALALVRVKNNGDDTYAEPQYLTLRDFLEEFIKHRLEVISRRAKFDLERAEARLHIVEGLVKALSMIDEVVDIIRRSQNAETAKANLVKKLSITEIQAQAILDMPLRRLASLERKKLTDEEKDLKSQIKDLKSVLASEPRRLDIVCEESLEIKEQYATPRRTIIIQSEEGHEAQITVADLVTPKEDQLIILTQEKIQRTDAKGYRENIQSGKPTTRAVDIIFKKIIAQPDDEVILVTSKGRLWHGAVGRIPLETSYQEFGLQPQEKVVATEIARKDWFLVMITTSGNGKRVAMEDCLDPRNEGSWANIIGLVGKDDEVLFAGIASEQAHIMICTGGSEENAPRVLRMEASAINPQATSSAKGMIAIKMMDDILVAAGVAEPDQWITGTAVVLSETGFIKQVNLSEFPVKGRGTQGVQVWRVTKKTGFVIDFTISNGKAPLDIFSANKKRLRLKPEDIPNTTRVAAGLDLNQAFGDHGTLFMDDRIMGIASL